MNFYNEFLFHLAFGEHSRFFGISLEKEVGQPFCFKAQFEQSPGWLGVTFLGWLFTRVTFLGEKNSAGDPC